MRTKRGYLFFLFLGAFTFLSLEFIPHVDATPSSIEGPFIVNPPWNIGAPNDNVEFVLNITDGEISTDHVLLLYTIRDIDEKPPTNEGEYEFIPMIEDTIDDSIRSWHCTLIPEENNKVIFFYTKIIDSLENISYHPDIEYPAQFRIKKPDPEFKITFFNIESIDEKQLTADITFSVDIIAGYDQPTVSLMLNDNHMKVERASRFNYFEQKTIRDLPLSGNPTGFPFDNYKLKLEYKVYFESESSTLFENVMISDYNDRSIWMHSFDIIKEKSERSSTIIIYNEFNRKIENAYIFIIPTLVCSLLLGGSHILPNNQSGIGKRLTITVGAFVFIIGYNASQVLQDMIPIIAKGITTAELTLIWLSAYSGIITIFSLIGYVYRDKKYNRIDFYIIFDMMSILLILIFYFTYPVININLPYMPQTSSLWNHINHLPYKIAFIVSMIYGCIFNLYKNARDPTLEDLGLDLDSKSVEDMDTKVAKIELLQALYFFPEHWETYRELIRTLRLSNPKNGEIGRCSDQIKTAMIKAQIINFKKINEIIPQIRNISNNMAFLGESVLKRFPNGISGKWVDNDPNIVVNILMDGDSISNELKKIIPLVKQAFAIQTENL